MTKYTPSESTLDSRKLRAEVWAMSDGRCFYCGGKTNPFATFSIDHMTPRSKGGSHAIDNLVPCCRRCNSAKKDMPIEEWAHRSPMWGWSDEYREEYGAVRGYICDMWWMDRLDTEEGEA